MSISFNNQKSPPDSIMATDPVTCTLTDIFSRIVHPFVTWHSANNNSYLYTYF